MGLFKNFKLCTRPSYCKNLDQDIVDSLNNYRSCISDRDNQLKTVSQLQLKQNDTEQKLNTALATIADLKNKQPVPCPDLEMVERPVNEIIQVMVDWYGMKAVSDSKIRPLSGKYLLPKRIEDVQAVFKWSRVGIKPYGNAIYIPELHDCESFGFSFKGVFCREQKLYGAGVYVLILWTQLGYHAINAVFTYPKDQVILNHFEPQNGQIYPNEWIIEQGLQMLKNIYGDQGQTKDQVLGEMIG